MKTFVNTVSKIKRERHVIDATDQNLGRLSVQISRLLMGKHKPTYEPNHDTGDFVVVINAARVKVTGNKLEDKVYYRHSNYPGGLKSIKLGDMMEKFPTRAIEYAVKGMLPHTRLGAQMNRKLRVYAGAEVIKATKPKTEKPVKAAKPKAAAPAKATKPRAAKAKAQAPKAETPKAEQPKAEQPKAVEPKETK
jgi:large subunit ribosomal protein L13